MQRPTRCLVVLSFLAGLVAWPARPAAAQASTVRCESQGSARQVCDIPTNAQVELARTLSQEACREGRNWGTGTGFIWVTGGCRADFTVTRTGYGQGGDYGQGGNAGANPNQLRACRTEADRRLAGYSYDQIQVEPDSRQGSVAYVRWRAGNMSGLCAVHANGRVLQFTNSATGGGAYPGTTTQIACESQRTERRECRIPSGARIRLLSQTSDSPCRLNDTYGQGADYIWVAKGCRGEFEVTTAGTGNVGGSTRVVCASALNTRRQCDIPQGAEVRLVRQMSDVTCRSGQNWGIGQGYIWVTRGCSGEFEVRGGSGNGWQGGTTPTTRRIVCESKSAARERCDAPGATAVRMVKQYSTNPCRLDQSFGVGPDYIWVGSGCRGEFEVTVGGGGVQPAPGGDVSNGTGLPNRVVCESQGGERTECRVKVGAQVKLVRQLSTTACTQNSTWGYGYGAIWVTKGCRGEFEVR